MARLSDKTPRVGAGVAIAQDAVDLADRLMLDRFAIVGHDWGARAAYTVYLLQGKLHDVAAIGTPTLMIQGAADSCDPPGLSEGLEGHFSGRYERVLLDAVGHFPHREAPAAVAAAILRHLGGP